MEEKLSVKRLTIRHYKNKDLYNQYANVRKDSDINIIGDSMTVYGTSVVDDLVSRVNANIEDNANKLKEIAEAGISQLNGKIADIKANTYTKAEADEKFQPKGAYVEKSTWDTTFVRAVYPGNHQLYMSINFKNIAFIKFNCPLLDYYDRNETDERYLKKGDAKNTYLSKTEAENKYLTKIDAMGKYLTQSKAESTYATKGELNNITIPDSYSKAESDERYMKKGEVPEIDTSNFVEKRNNHIILGDCEIWVE